MSRVALRHPVMTALGVALAIRLVTVLGVAAGVRGHYLFPDESQYVALGQLAAKGQLTHATWGGYGWGLYHQAAAYMRPVTLLFRVFGAHPELAAAWAAIFGAATASLTVLIAGTVVSEGWSLVAGLLVALLPSQVLWSSVILRESMAWSALALVLLALLKMADQRNLARLATWGGAAAVGVLALGSLKPQLVVATTWALAAGGLAVWGRRPLVTAAVALVLAAAVPSVTGQGPFGWRVASHAAGQLGTVRSAMAQGARSAFISPKTTTAPAAARSGPAQTKQSSPSVAPSAETDSNTPSGNLRALPRGVEAVLLRPFPWEASHDTGLLLARGENMVWYLLYALGAVGLWAGWQRSRRLVISLFLFLGTTVGVEALIQGNLGTAFRHRAELFWGLSVLAVVGSAHLWQGRSRRRSDHVDLRERYTAAPSPQ